MEGEPLRRGELATVVAIAVVGLLMVLWRLLPSASELKTWVKNRFFPFFNCQYCRRARVGDRALLDEAAALRPRR